MVDAQAVAGVASNFAGLRSCGGSRMSGRRRLLTIGHSYCVGLNRRLPNEIARVGDWDVTAVGPARFRGDFGWHTLEPAADELCTAIPVPVRFRPPRSRHALRTRSCRRCSPSPGTSCTAGKSRTWPRLLRLPDSSPPDVPLVVATFQNIAKRYPPPFNWIERYSMSRANGVIAFGRTAAEVVAARGFDSRRRRKRHGHSPRGRSHAVQARRGAPRRNAGQARMVRRDACRRLSRTVWFRKRASMLLTTALDRVTTPWRALIVGSGPLEDRVSRMGPSAPRSRPHDHQRSSMTKCPRTSTPWTSCARRVRRRPAGASSSAAC